MSSRLTEIVENKKSEVAARKMAASLPDVFGPGDGSFLEALQQKGTNLICELKPKSPSAGVLKKNFDFMEMLPHYKEHAAAISVLTDQKYFGGSLSLLADVSCKTTQPTLCKDFFIDPFQCIEARLAGAQAVLLIVKILDDALLAQLHKATTELGMNAVVEVQNQDELDRALAVKPEIILINNRNLDTFEISLSTTRDLAPNIPEHVVAVSARWI